MEGLEKVMEDSKGDLARIVTKAEAKRLIKSDSGAVVGVEFLKDGKMHVEYGPVVIATGGFGADYQSDSLLAKHRPELRALPTTNGDHCTGDGIKMALAAGAGTVDMTSVQVHPTGLVHPGEPDAKVKFLAAEALRGVGGILLDANGERFCDELGRRDYVSGEMNKGKGPFRLILNGAASKEIEWHCKHYVGRGIMKKFGSGAEVAREIGVPPAKLAETFAKYNQAAKSKSCPFGKKFFHNAPLDMNDSTFHVAQVCTVVHYTMGGLAINNESQVVSEAGIPVPGLYAAGEVAGGIHGRNRLGGNSLLDCVVFGRVAGDTACRHLLSSAIKALRTSRNGGETALNRVATLNAHFNPEQAAAAGAQQWAGAGAGIAASPAAAYGGGAGVAALTPPPVVAKASGGARSFTEAEIAKHNSEGDLWVVIEGKVYDLTSFLPDHPGGKKAIMLFAGKDATEEFNMLHPPNVLKKYLSPEALLGTVA
jgi:flavocytochrome c